MLAQARCQRFVYDVSAREHKLNHSANFAQIYLGLKPTQTRKLQSPQLHKILRANFEEFSLASFAVGGRLASGYVAGIDYKYIAKIIHQKFLKKFGE